MKTMKEKINQVRKESAEGLKTARRPVAPMSAERAANEMQLVIPALSANESFARSVVAAFAVQMNPTLDEINDIKTAVSEAVTNAVVHGYEGKGIGEITIGARIEGGALHITVTDSGVGIPDVGKALEPFFTTKPEQERSGMGFTVMQTFTDDLRVSSGGGVTTVSMTKVIGK